MLVDAEETDDGLRTGSSSRCATRASGSRPTGWTALHLVQPGRRVDDAPLRRHRPRPRDLEAPRRADGRHDLGRERAEEGLDLPHLAPRRPRPTCRRRSPLDEGLPHLAGKRILIVDDNATNREIVTRHARVVGDGPVAVERRVAALELIAQGEPFDVAVLDMMMPEMDGLALAGEIRQHRDEPRAAAAAPDLARATAAGAVGRRVLGAAREAAQGVAALQHARATAHGGQGRRGGGRGRDGRKAREVGAADPARRGQRR